MEYKDEVQDKMKIIAFGDSKYKKIAHNWALHLHRHEIDNYTIYSLDQDIYNYLVENKINTQLLDLNIFNKKTWSWDERVKSIIRLLDQRHDILHSDLDAIWLKDPLCFIDSKYDIVTSTGTWPKKVFTACGFTACLGWIHYKSTPNTISFLKSTIANPEDCLEMRKMDDQFVFNKKLFLDKKVSVNVINNNQKQVCVDDMKILALSQSIVSRHTPHNEHTYVAHPLSGKHINREKFLKNKKLWILS